MTTVPRRKDVRGCREKTSFGNAEEEPGSEKPAVAMYDAHERHDCSPREHNDGDPDGGSEPFEDDVGGDFEEGVGEEEDGQANVVLLRGEAKIFRETRYIGVADYEVTYQCGKSLYGRRYELFERSRNDIK